jgi:hypothetical protein
VNLEEFSDTKYKHLLFGKASRSIGHISPGSLSPQDSQTDISFHKSVAYQLQLVDGHDV